VRGKFLAFGSYPMCVLQKDNGSLDAGLDHDDLDANAA
jgi:hypothetical protein